MIPNQLRDRLAQYPRRLLAQLPTPLEPLPRLTAVLSGPQLRIKRDDNLGQGMGGNKVRKLAFIMAEVVNRGKRKVITYGGLLDSPIRVLGEPHPFLAADIPLIEGNYVGPGYAVLTEGSRRAVELLAQTKGILLDPVYTGKGMAGLMDLVENGRYTSPRHPHLPTYRRHPRSLGLRRRVEPVFAGKITWPQS